MPWTFFSLRPVSRGNLHFTSSECFLSDGNIGLGLFSEIIQQNFGKICNILPVILNLKELKPFVNNIFINQKSREFLVIFSANQVTTKDYSGSSKTSKMGLFAKILYSQKPLNIFAKSSILDVRQGCGYTSGLVYI